MGLATAGWVQCGEKQRQIDPRKVLFPPLLLKLGLMKQFITVLDKESAAFMYLWDFFPKLSETKVKACIFVKPQIKKDHGVLGVPQEFHRTEEATWNSFVAVIRGFLGNHKAENYVELVETLMELRQNGLQDVPQSLYSWCLSWWIQEHGSILGGARQTLPLRYTGLWTPLPRIVWWKHDGRLHLEADS